MIPPRRALPEFKPDLTGLATAIRQTLPEVQRTRFLGFKLGAEKLKKAIENPSPYERTRGADEKQLILDQLDKTLSAISSAEGRFASQADSIIEELVACFESAHALRHFSITMSRFRGFGFLSLANSRGKIVNEETPWLRPLVNELSPAHLTAFTRSFRQHVLFGLNRDMKLFHEDALMAYLQSDIGDVRHLEHDVSYDEAVPNHHKPLKDAIQRGEGIQATFYPVEKAPDLTGYWLTYDDWYLRGFPHLIRDYLGLDLEPTDISATHSNIEVAVSEMLKAEQTSYRGYLLEHFIRFPKDSNLKKVPSSALWPYIAENFSILDRALFENLKPNSQTPKQAYSALQAIEVLPAVPMRYKDVLEHLTEFGKKWEKELSKKLLASK